MFFFALRRVRPRVAACLLGGATLLRLRLAAADGLLRALAGPCVRLRPLPVVRQVDPFDACQDLALPLLVPWIGADDHGRTVPLDHAASFAHGLDGRAYFHVSGACR